MIGGVTVGITVFTACVIVCLAAAEQVAAEQVGCAEQVAAEQVAAEQVGCAERVAAEQVAAVERSSNLQLILSNV